MRRIAPFLRIAGSIVLSFVIMSVVPVSAQQAGPTWQSTIIWAPNLTEAGTAISAHVNQIDAACNVDVDPVASTNGAGPEGAVYAFLISWSCPETNASSAGLTWQSAMIWDPTLEGSAAALSAHLNETEAACRVDVDTVQSTNGAGPEGVLYAFLITWAC